MLSVKCTYSFSIQRNTIYLLSVWYKIYHFLLTQYCQLPINCHKVMLSKATEIYKANCPLLNQGFLIWGPRIGSGNPRNPWYWMQTGNMFMHLSGKKFYSFHQVSQSVHKPKTKNHFSKKGTEKNYRNNHKTSNEMAICTYLSMITLKCSNQKTQDDGMD